MLDRGQTEEIVILQSVGSLLAEASFPCIQRAGEKRPLSWVESVCVERVPRFLS